MNLLAMVIGKWLLTIASDEPAGINDRNVTVVCR